MSSIFNPTEMNKAMADFKNISEIIMNVPALFAKIASLEEKVNSTEIKNSQDALNKSAERCAALEAELAKERAISAKERAISAELRNKLESISVIITGTTHMTQVPAVDAPNSASTHSVDIQASAPSTPKVERKVPTPITSPKMTKLWGDYEENEEKSKVSFATAAATAPLKDDGDNDFTPVNHHKKSQKYIAPKTFICMNMVNHGRCDYYDAQNPWESSCQFVHNVKEMGKLTNPCRHKECTFHINSEQMCIFDHSFDHQMMSANYLIDKIKPELIRGYRITYPNENEQ
jgi:hypothetical protein